VSAKRLGIVVALAVVMALSLAPSAQAKVVGGGRACITRPAAAAMAGSRMRDLVRAPVNDRLTTWIRHHRSAAVAAAARVQRSQPVVIETWIHVIRGDLTVQGGNIPRTWIDAQMQVLNDSFGGKTGGADTGFQFHLAGVTRTTSANWFTLTGQGNDRKMKEALKVGGPETLNIYTADIGKLLGYAYYPQFLAQIGALDGVVVHYQSLPGGGFEIYSEGDTATHEVGHWLALFHTFEGGCNGDGDEIDDTPAEASPAFFCPEGRDTCPASGLDPITNFMDYTQDSCMFEFTPDQAVRMQQAWTAFRT
jgi:hypothetical protein